MDGGQARGTDLDPEATSSPLFPAQESPAPRWFGGPASLTPAPASFQEWGGEWVRAVRGPEKPGHLGTWAATEPRACGWKEETEGSASAGRGREGCLEVQAWLSGAGGQPLDLNRHRSLPGTEEGQGESWRARPLENTAC